MDIGVSKREVVGILPVRGDTPPGQQARIGEQERPGAGRAVTPCRARLPAQPVRDRGVRRARNPKGTNHDQSIARLRRLFDPCIGKHRGAGRAFQRSAVFGDQANNVGRPGLQLAVRLEQRVLNAGDLQQMRIERSKYGDEHGF
ncbi:hypothetical protein LRS08_02370 [Sphingomonas sp. J315]|nr:hypothetical protein [Sphingomonas sp. J315]UUY00008.1 hypothetical protein LRS08_02370 [Sphingomonas sp. J315]